MASPTDTRTPKRLFPPRVRAVFWLGLALMICIPWFNIPRDNADSAGMLAHLHAYFIDADLLYDNEYRALRVAPTFAFVTAEGVVSNHWPAGATWLQAPGYALGLTVGRVLSWAGVAKASAYGVVPLLAIRAWAMVVWLGLGVGIARWWRGSPGSPRSGGAVAAAAMLLGTPALYYAAEAPLRPHLWGFAVTAVFVAVWSRPPPAADRSLWRAVGLGALVGLAACVRPQLAVLVLLAGEDAIRGAARQRWRRLGLTCGAATIWPLLHLRVQLWMYGGSVADYGGPLSHHVRAFLWSPHHGALVWTPLLAIAAVALVRAAVMRERGSWIIVAVLAHQIWLDAGMRDISAYGVLGTRTWSGGTGFGARKLLDVLPLCLPAVRTLWDAAAQRGAGRWLAAVTLALIVPSLALHAAVFVDPQAASALLDWRGLEVVASRAWSATAWRAALEARALPNAAIVGLAGVPLVLGAAVVRIAIAVQRTPERARHWSTLGVAGLVGVGVAAQLWLSVLLVRSDATLLDDPQRMAQARTHMHAAHEAAVARIPSHHAALRAVLGTHAAPPVLPTP